MTTEKKSTVVWGCKAIAAVINRSERQTYYLLESGHLPAKKFGQQWAGDEVELRAAFLSGVEVGHASA